MKARIQSVADIKKIAARELEEEFKERYQDAVLGGVIQGMAFVMYTLELNQGWKETRQQRLFDDMLSVLNLPEAAPWIQSYKGADLQKHIEAEFGVDFDKILQRIEALPPE